MRKGYSDEYVDSSIKADLDMLASVKKERNNQLNKSALSLFGLAYMAGIPERYPIIREELKQTALNIGLHEVEINGTLKSAFNAKHKTTRKSPNGMSPEEILGMFTVNPQPLAKSRGIAWKHTTERKNSAGKLVDKPMPTRANLQALMSHHGVTVSYDELLLKTNIEGWQ